jgi:molybdopterin biosynthesis enzyme
VSAATDLPPWDSSALDGCAVRAADALAVVPESVEAFPAGASVEAWWLDRP